MVLVRNWPFFHFVILGLVGKENVFYDILERKNPFLGYTKKSSKNRKIKIFPKGLDHGFCQKLTICPFLYFRTSRPGKCLSQPRKMCTRYSGTTKSFSKLKKQTVQTVEKLRFFQRGQSMVLVKNWPFFHFVILGLVGQESVFYDILERKTPFQALKTKSSNTRKIEIFPKGLDHGFCQKLAIFPFFYF